MGHNFCLDSQIVVAEFEALDNDQSKVCVLGMYGLPGSGKSTICRYLCENLFSQFAGKTIYLELPFGAKNEELVIKSKELLKQRTNFNNKMDLSQFSDLEKVYYLLKGTDFVSSRVFLVVDNISSQESRDYVNELLWLGLTVGSKVLLVARSINVLHPLLQEDGSHQSSHYVYGSMSVPGLNKEEALQILLQSGDGVGQADSYAPEAALIPRHKEIMEEVVNMCGFSEEHCRTNFVPLVLKLVRQQLREHEPNVEKWNRTIKSFQIEVELCKEEALRKMVLKSFETLPGSRLQTLFLDVALFIVPLSYLDGSFHKLDEACSHLSLIHGCKSEEIEFEMQKLQQHGFLTIWKGGIWTTPTISVHDFYLEFAASLEEASKYYWSSGLRWSKNQRNQTIETVGITQPELRTVVLELDEGYEHFEVSSDFSGVRAMVLRNCESLKVLQGFANLRSLLSLEIHSCPSLKWVEPPATGNKQPYVQRFKWVNAANIYECSSSKRLFCEDLPQIGIKRPLMTVNDLFLEMKGLQVLALKNTGIRQYVDTSRYWPQLRVLEVWEWHMKGLRVCNLPNLERFGFYGDAKLINFTVAFAGQHDFVPTRRGIMWGKEVLAGCPNVQEVHLQCVTFEDEANHMTLASSHLRRLYLESCDNLTEVRGFGGFPMLQGLEIRKCPSLKRVSGLGNLVSLQDVCLRECPNIQLHCSLPDLESLIELRRLVYSGTLDVDFSSGKMIGLERLERLQELYLCTPADSGHTVLLVDLARLLGIMAPCCFSLKWLSLCGLGDLRSLKGIQFLGSLEKLDLVGLQNLSCFRGIECLEELQELQVRKCLSVEEMPSLSGLVKLRQLSFSECKNLRSLEGCDKLDQLQGICLRGCESLARFPLDLRNWNSSVRYVGIEGSKFASGEAVVAWAADEQVPLPLRQASLSILRRHFVGSDSVILRNWNSSIRYVGIEGSMLSGEVAADGEAPLPLCGASLSRHFFGSDLTKMSEVLVDMAVQMARKRCFYDEEDDDDDDKCDKSSNEEDEDNYGNYDEEGIVTYDEEGFVVYISQLAKDYVLWHGLRPVLDWLEEGPRYLAKLPKQRLIDLYQSDGHFRIFLIHLFCHLCKDSC